MKQTTPRLTPKWSGYWKRSTISSMRVPNGRLSVATNKCWLNGRPSSLILQTQPPSSTSWNAIGPTWSMPLRAASSLPPTTPPNRYPHLHSALQDLLWLREYRQCPALPGRLRKGPPLHSLLQRRSETRPRQVPPPWADPPVACLTLSGDVPNSIRSHLLGFFFARSRV